MERSRSRRRIFDDMVGLNDLAHADESLVIVALPSPDDEVRKVSSEKEPHLTLLYLGDPKFDETQVGIVTEFVEHAASQIHRFYLDAEGRGILGDEDADVLFFNKDSAKDIGSFRTKLLRNDLISKAFLSAEQYPEWTPHLTLGYPASPAKKSPDDDDYDRIYGVSFDRIAMWTGDYVGPTFQLKRYEMEVAMSQLERGRSFLAEESFAHYGIKGMHWGVRRSESSGKGSAPAAKTRRPRRSEDAKNVEKAFGKIDRGGTNALSNNELQGVITRLNLEQQYSKLMTAPSPQQTHAIRRGHSMIREALLYGKTYNEVMKFMDSKGGKLLKNGFKVAGAAYTGGASGAAAAGASIAVRRMSNHFTNVGG